LNTQKLQIPIESEFWTTDLPDAHAHLAKLDSFEMEKLLQQSARQMGNDFDLKSG
jgi:hypothetical protein